MAEFFTNLWESIFTPGPTPTLVVATNATFAVLQLLLLALLAMTRSVHFVILSVLSAGLWWSINWFVREINALKEAERLKADRAVQDDGADAAAADSEDTETEEVASKAVGLRQRQNASAASAASPATATVTAKGTGKRDEADLQASTSSLSVRSIDSRKRTSTGNVSGTDSEWDKLDSEAE